MIELLDTAGYFCGIDTMYDDLETNNEIGQYDSANDE